MIMFLVFVEVMGDLGVVLCIFTKPQGIEAVLLPSTLVFIPS